MLIRHLSRLVYLRRYPLSLFLVGLLSGCATGHRTQPPIPEAAVPQPKSESESGKWVVPAGWVPIEPAPLEVAGFTIPDASGDGRVRVMKLNDYHFPLLANANRCREQIGLGPIDEGSLNEILKPVQTASGEQGKAFQLVGAEKSVLFAAFVRGETTWFFKLTAPNPLAEKQRDSFDQFIGSFHL